MRAPSPSAQRYLEQALAMIDKSGGSHGVNLREVARALGCSHTNAYNYFSDRDALLHQALGEAMQRQFDHSRRALQLRGGTALSRLERLIDSQVEFALTHPGWFRFVWLEPLATPPPPTALALMEQAGELLSELVREASSETLSATQARERAEDLHTYLHGALCKAVAGRTDARTPEERQAQVRRAARRFLRELLGQRRRSK